MNTLFLFLLYAHFVGLALIAGSFLPLLGMMPERDGSDSPTPTSSRYLTLLGHVGILVSLISGPLMIWVKYGGFGGVSHWFWVKMLFLVALVVGIVLSARSSRRLRNGDKSAARGVRAGRSLAAVSLFGVVLAAVLAFG